MTKRTHIQTITVLLALVLGTAGTVCAQNETVQYGKENLARDYCTGYTITVNTGKQNNPTLYLYSAQFGGWKFVDSAVVENGTAVFTAKTAAKSNKEASSLIPKGFYKVVARNVYTLLRDEPDSDVEMSLDFDDGKKSDKPKRYDTFAVEYSTSLILNQQTSIKLSLDLSRDEYEAFDVRNSEENQVFFSTMRMINRDMGFSSYQDLDGEIYSTMPKSLFAQAFHLDTEIFQAIVAADFDYSKISKSDYHRILSIVDFTDGRLCHSVSSFFYFAHKYLTSDSLESVDEVITEVDTILTRAARGGRYQCGQYAQWLYNIFDMTGDPYYEPVMLHIYDTYDRGWIPEDQERRIKRKMDVVRKIAPGALIPELTAYDIDGKQHSTNEIQTKYTILWFWDPDCDHCQEETPILHDLYRKRADELNFEVFAVEVNDDYPRWKAFSEMNDLGDWINLSTSMGETSVDYIEYFDIVTTPVILLIDNEKNHAIIARQVTLDEIVRAMER